MRVAQIVPYPLFPTWSGGKIRVLELARAMAAHGVELTLVTPYHFRQRHSHYRDETFRLVEIPYPFVVQSLLTDCVFPYQYLMSYHPGFATLIRRHLRSYDAYVFEQVPFAALLDDLQPGSVAVYSAQNVEFDYVRQECRNDSQSERVGRRIHACEGRLARECARVWTVSAADGQRMREVYGIADEKISVYPNGITDVRAACADDRRLRTRFPAVVGYSRRVLFSGSNVAHNRIAVRYILDYLAPACPDMGFIILGTCGDRFRDGRRANVFFDSELSRFDDYALEGTIGLNPVCTGGGTNLKVLQYLSRGLPVVTTPFGLRGHEEFKTSVVVAQLEEMAGALRQPKPQGPSRERLEAWLWHSIGGRMVQELRGLKERARG